jgi:RNA polymerase-binding transcription factor DksA
MTKDELQKLDDDLEQEEKNLMDQLNRIADKNPLIKGDFTVRMPNYGDEDDENTQEAVDLNNNFALTQELETKLNSIRKTRQEIKEGIYGTNQ